MMMASFVRNTKHPYDGVCVVLEERDDRLKVFTERGEYVGIERRHTVPASLDQCITKSGPDRLLREHENYHRLRTEREYSLAMDHGEVAESLGDWDEAADWYGKACAVECSNEAQERRAACLRRSGRHREALVEYRARIERGTDSARLYCEQAVSLAALGSFVEALASAGQALAANALYAEAFRLMAELHRKLADQHQQQAEECEQKRREIVNPDGRFTVENENGQTSLFD